jgi:hypothetical protein
MLRTENVSDDEVVGEAEEGLARDGKTRGSSEGRDATARGSHGGMCCVGNHYRGWRVRVVVRRCFPEKCVLEYSFEKDRNL